MDEQNKNVSVEVKFAHDAGHTVFAISDDHKWLLTGGCDGEVRKWSLEQGKEDDDPESFDVGSAIFALEILENKFYVGSASIDAKSFELDTGNYLGRFTRFSSYSYCLDISSDRKSIAVGSGDFIIKVVEIENSATTEFCGHEAPVLCVKFDPKNKYLASSSCDGSVIIWDLKTQNKVKTFTDVCEKSNDFSNTDVLFGLSWNSSGSLMAIPVGNEIHLINRDSWDVNFKLTSSQIDKVSICAFDPNNRYLAIVDTKGKILVWNLIDKSEPAAIFVNERNICVSCIRFSKTNERQIVATDKNGQLLFVKLTDTFVSTDTNQASTDHTVAEDQFAMLDFDDDDDFTEEEFIKQQEIKAKAIVSTDNIEPSDEQKSNHFTIVGEKTDYSEQEMNENHYETEEFEEDDDLIDIGALKAKYENKIFQSEDLEMDDVEKKVSETTVPESKPEIKKEITVSVKPLVQDAFQPGSTPVDIPDRFMVWNNVGIVTCSQNDQYESSIDVEFHDSTIYRPIHMSNVHNYTLADISNDALLLAVCKTHLQTDALETDSTSISSHVFCLHFASWDSNKEWRFDMPPEEDIRAITLSGSFAIVATDRFNIRLFTLSGIQLHTFSLPGPVVSMAAQDNQLMIIFHDGSGLPGEQCLSMYLCKLSCKSLMPITNELHPLPVALNPRTLLLWAGFTEEGNACTVDSNYVVRIFNRTSNCWVSIAEMQSRNKNDTYFIISISEIQEQIKAVSCRGAKYPLVFPRPTMVNIPFEISLCESGNTKTKLEEQLIRINLRKLLLEDLLDKGFDVEFSIEENNKKLIEILIKLFAVAINANSNALAIEIAYLMPTEAALEGAIRYASQKRKQIVVNKLNQILNERTGELESQDMFEEPPPKKKVLSKEHSSKNKTDSQNEDNEPLLAPKPMKLISSANPFKKS